MRINKNLPVLLVDDDAMVRDILTEYLISFGFKNILPVKDARQGLKIINDVKVPIGLILSDWEMPGATGLTLLKAVRNHPLRAATPFIMITSQRSMERFKVAQAAQWHVDAYLVKPFTSDLLRDKIWSVLGWPDGLREVS